MAGMAIQAEDSMVEGDGGYISDDSSFYGKRPPPQ